MKIFLGLKMREYLLKRPMLLCAIICIAIAVAGYYSKTLLCVLGIFYAAIFTLAIIKKSDLKVYFCLFIIFLMFLNTTGLSTKIKSFEKISSEEQVLQTVVSDITYKSEDFNFAVFEVTDSSSNLKGQKITAAYSPKELELGDKAEITVKVKPLREDEYKSQYFAKGVYLEGDISKITPDTKNGDFILKAVSKTRDYIRKSLFSNMGYEEASTLCALVFGDKDYFTAEFEDNVRNAGVSHVMVVSGLHLSIFVAFTLSLTKRRYYNRYLKAAITVGIVFIVMAVCGFTMSIMRAGVTFIVAAVGTVLKKDNTPANTLGAATVLILITSPFSIFSVAFQLSLLSTYGILAVALPINEYLESREIIKSSALLKLFTSGLITLSATVLTLPVSIYYFGKVSLVGVITNVLISYAVSVALKLTVVGLAVNLVFGGVAEMIFALCEIVVKYVNFVINFLGSQKFSAISVPRHYCIYAIILIILIFYVLLACKKRIDMIKLNEMNEKIIFERGKRKKWR